ncbi:MAG: hypothetical protein KAW12_13530 [Candidatus Aminicenantes bacterium]|nr:hypothetical protein [Candidatus Aminicenantes bacterium]
MTQIEMSNFSKDAAFLFILARIDQYKGEKEFFDNKYKRNFYEVEQEAHAVKGKEDFQLEEDLEDWEFAIKSLEYWTKEYQKLRNNAAVA